MVKSKRSSIGGGDSSSSSAARKDHKEKKQKSKHQAHDDGDDSSQLLAKQAAEEKRRAQAALKALESEDPEERRRRLAADDDDHEGEKAAPFDHREDVVAIGNDGDEEEATASGGGGSKSKKDASSSAPKPNTTVFVSSLPYETTTTDLITHFSFLGPVRTGFVVKDRASGVSKGVGYVTYASAEDAAKAVEELDQGAFGAQGRKIRVDWADKKPSMLERKTKARQQLEQDVPLEGDGHDAQESPRKVVQPRKTPRAAPATKDTPGGAATSSSANDPHAIRTVVLSGIPAGVDKNTLWKKVRKLDGIDGESKESLLYPAPSLSAAGTAAGDAHILFATHQAATAAIAKLHAHVYKGATLSCALKKRVDTNTASGRSNRAGRLIVRNIAWQVTTEDLRTLFLPYGPIVGIDLPVSAPLPSKNKDDKTPAAPRAKGFAFVWFLQRDDAAKAIEGVNGHELKGRAIAVDWALSKERWEEAKATTTATSTKEPETEKDEEAADEEMESSGDDDEEEAEEEDVDMEAGEDEEEQQEEAAFKPTLPAVEEGSTLFIRNLPFEVTEEELRNLFRTFGPLRYAKITMDRATGRSRGTGFACFWKREHADEALDEASRVREVTGANAVDISTKNPFSMGAPSVLQVDPSSSAASRLVLHGRTLDVVRALTREDATMKKEDAERQRMKSDKRNTYLMREGVVFPNTPAAATLPEVEVEKRQTSFKTRRQLLESNPSLYISKTRLSVRQLPLFVTDRTLKRLAIHAVRAFDDEVKAGTREGLSREEMLDETVSAAVAARTGAKKRGERVTPVVQSKVQRQTDKTDALSGLGRSKGFGFLEMRTHREALKVLRWANNNPDVGSLVKEWFEAELVDVEKQLKEKLAAARAATGDAAKDLDDLELRYKRVQSTIKEGVQGAGMRQGKTLLIEFSVENVQVVKRRSEKLSGTGESRAPRDRKRKARDDAGADSDGDDGGAKRSRGNDRKGSKKGSSSGGRKEGGDGDVERGSSKDEAEKKSASGGLGGLIGRKRKERRGKK